MKGGFDLLETTKTKEEILKLLKEHKISYIDLDWFDYKKDSRFGERLNLEGSFNIQEFSKFFLI